MRIFAQNRYEEASVREIAAAAGVTVAMVGYHFDGKEGLYLAVAERIVQAGLERVGPAMIAARKVLVAESPARGDIVEAMMRLLRDLLQTTRDEDTFDWARIMLREQLDSSKVGDILHAQLISPYMSTLAHLLALTAGRTVVDRTDLVRAFALMGQMIVFRAARDASGRLLGGHSLLGDDVDFLMDLIERQLAT